MGHMNFSCVGLKEGLMELWVCAVQHLVCVHCLRERLGAIVQVLHVIIARWGHYITKLIFFLLDDCKNDVA